MRLKSLYKTICFLLLPAMTGLFCPATGPAGTKPSGPEPLPVHQPEQITAEADPVLSATVSRDGKWMIYSSGRSEGADLWLRSADPSMVIVPKRLTSDPSLESEPAFSPDGRFVAYVGTANDVKGDIFLLDIKSETATPVRLTGRETADGGPCFSPDGRTLYFHQSGIDDSSRQLVALDVKNRAYGPKLLPTGGDAAYPSVSPDGKTLAFVSSRHDPSGDILVMKIGTADIRRLTSGSCLDFSPAWSMDGNRIFFSRIAIDTNRDGGLTLEDNAAVYTINLGDNRLWPYPLTPATYTAVAPVAAGSRLFFLSSRGGISNSWALPEEGSIPSKDSAETQLAFAHGIAVKIPFDPYLSVLAYYRVLKNFPDLSSFASQAANRIGDIYEKMGLPEAALAAYRIVSDRYPETQPESAFSRIRQVVIQTRETLKNADTSAEKRVCLKKGLADLDEMSLARENSEIKARAEIARAGLLMEAGADASALLAAITVLERVSADFPGRDLTAEALVLKADIYSRLGRFENVYPTYLRVARDFPDVEQWADAAVDRILEQALSETTVSGADARIKILRKIAEENRDRTAILAMGALNRLADTYFDAGEWTKAKDVYGQVLEQFPQQATQTAAARLSLAEILYREERFRQALDLYGSEIASRSYDDHIYQLARRGYIQKSVASGEFLYRLGEIHSARKTFRELMDYDDAIVEAHRGYIKCAAAMKDIPAVMDVYRKRLVQDSNNPVALYAVALCKTYLEGRTSLVQAENLLRTAIRFNGRVEYFHQTLGYVLEVLETVYKEKGKLEASLESYLKAYFLNDPVKNPANSANLSLNLGNIYYLLGRYNKAFSYYSLRLEAGSPFDDQNTEILFYRRLGACAFQLGKMENTIAAFTRTLDLIDSRMDPQQASKAFDRMHRFIMDRIVAPALRHPELSTAVRAIAETQSDINRRLAHLTPEGYPPPAPEWNRYRDDIQALLSEQERVFPRAISLARKMNTEDMTADQARQTLAVLLLGVENALGFPERLVRLKAEMLDRLGLAYQEAGGWEKAVDIFETVYSLNNSLMLTSNLSRNRRSAAYSRYRLAGVRSGRERKTLLKQASDDFYAVLELVEQYGVPRQTKKQADALVSLSFQIAMEDTAATQAAHGFSADQEKRLAQVFISRIHVELGELEPAEIAMREQLEQYPPDKPVSGRDRYGVSLLFHRAGLLAAAQGRPLEAFHHFYRSALLTLEMKNSVSTAINVANMAGLLARMPADLPEQRKLFDRLQKLDRQTAGLLAADAPAGKNRFAATYHNMMGAYSAALAENSPRNPEGAAESATENTIDTIRRLQMAGTHFMRGIDILENDPSGKDRTAVALLAALHLNLARISLDLGETVRAGKEFHAALAQADKGLLPDLKWRALAGLGRLDEAIEVLSSVTVLRAGCGPGEITTAFAPQVMVLLGRNEIEAAFNLVERLSELERFNRTAFLIRDIPPADRALFRATYPRLERMNQLREQISNAEGEEKRYLEKRLDDERNIAMSTTGKNFEKLPDIFRNLPDADAKEQAIILLGIAAEAEAEADARVTTPDGDTAARMSERYFTLLERYSALKDEAMARRPAAISADVFTLFGPEPFDDVGVMDSLPENARLIRLFRPDPNQSEVAVFTLTPEEITLSRADSLDAIYADITANRTENLYIAYEKPSALPVSGNIPVALSATHLVRSIMNRKPFKRNLLAVPALDSTVDGYEIFGADSVDDPDSDFRHLISNCNTLLLSNPVSATLSVPTRAGEVSETFMTTTDRRGVRIRLEQVLMNAANISLALLPGSSIRDAYLIGHLFSIWGCPSVLLSESPETGSTMIYPFLKAYPETSTVSAVRDSFEKSAERYGWMLIGYAGMTSGESALFAREHFEEYVINGRKAFDEDKPAHALSWFENAVLVAKQDQSLNPYLPALYGFGRESAFRSNNLEKAAAFAQALTDLLEQQAPGTEAHAEALLRMGLILAKQERYEKAVPVLEDVVEITTHLELEPQQIQAMVNLGAVLEDATEYDRALGMFESAVSLSKVLDKKDLLAKLYVNIGKIYHIRLSQYAPAIKNYREALSLFRETENSEGAAESLLNIGRCYRFLGNFADADRYYLEVLSLVESDTLNADLKAKVIIEQANNAWFQGRYQDAFTLQRTAYQLSVEYNLPLVRIVTLNTAGLTWWTLGNYPKALTELNKALAEARGLTKREYETATTLNNIGLVYREMGRYTEAMGAFEEALAIDKKLRSRWAIAYDLRNIALTYLKTGRADQAVPLFEEASETARAIGNQINEAKALLGLGEAHLATDHPEAAEEAFQRALNLARPMSMSETIWRSLYGMAKVQLQQNPGEAETLLRQAVDVIEDMRADIKIDLLKESFIDDKLSVYEALVSLLAGSERVVEAFEMAERSRARNFIDLLGNQHLSLSRGIDQEYYTRHQVIRAGMTEHQALLAQTTEKTEREIYRQTLADLTSEYQDLMLDIEAGNPQLSSMISVPSIDADKLLDRLDSDVALLSYYVLPEETFCWVIRREGIRLFRSPVGRDELGRAVLDYRRMIQNLEPLEQLSEQLFKWLLAPVMPGLEGAGILGIIPYGPLHYLSFATLSNGKNFLVDRFPLFYLPSASILGYTLDKRRTGKKNLNVLAVGNPDLQNPLLDLPFTEHEVNSIKWNFPNITVLTGKTATEDWVAANIEKFGIIHLASHGEFNTVNPLFSSIKLSKGSEGDGNLEAAEVFGLKINADLVVLSACQTGLGKVTAGDDVIGLNRAFFYAGTHTLVSSLWRVSDISTAVLIKAFYRQYVLHNKAKSLRAAMLHVKQQYPHPGYWGAFTLVGDYY
ncbi:MAG: tetratricopeptide repeat protein [Pseudomonadota bacterium]